MGWTWAYRYTWGFTDPIVGSRVGPVPAEGRPHGLIAALSWQLRLVLNRPVLVDKTGPGFRLIADLTSAEGSDPVLKESMEQALADHPPIWLIREPLQRFEPELVDDPYPELHDLERIPPIQ